MKRLALGAGLVSIATAIALAAAAWMGWQRLNAPMVLGGESIQIQLERGDSLNDLIRLLETGGADTGMRALYWYARLNGDAGRLKAGEYVITDGSTPLETLARVVSGDVLMHEVTIPEGWAFRQMLTSIQEHPAIQVVLADVDGAEIMSRLGHAGMHPEGRFFPDTYRFEHGTRDLDVLLNAFDAMDVLLKEAWTGRDRNLSLKSADEALVLASIIEKETSLDSERSQVAGVFTRRLALGMRLQADPTVIYGLGDAFDGNIRKADLQRDTPYNTYTRAGLPPTPIALPGRASVLAAVHPDQGAALYFMATGNGDGSHYFSASLEEHNKAVQRYLAQLRKKRRP